MNNHELDTMDGPAIDHHAAIRFIDQHGDTVDRARLTAWQTGEMAGLWPILGRCQNPDGGWSNGIDPEYTGGHSSVQSTIEALRIIWQHDQADHPAMQKTMQFLRTCVMPDGTWQELPEVLDEGPEWYQPANFRVWETASIAGYCLELGYTEVWARATRYVRATWPDMPPPEVPHPYWAALLLVGRSHNETDRSIAASCVEGLRQFIRRDRVDAYDISWVIEVLSITDPPDIDTLMMQLGDQIAGMQAADGGLETDYGSALRAKATLNALMTLPMLAQYFT